MTHSTDNDNQLVPDGTSWEVTDGSVIVHGGRLYARAEGMNEPADLGLATPSNLRAHNLDFEELLAPPEDLSEESWCLGCALLHDSIKFTPEMAEQMGQWVICGDCTDIFGLVAESTPERLARWNATFDPEPMVMDIPSAD